MSKTLKILSVVFLGVFIAVGFLQPVETEDVWWHLKAGEYIAQNHHVPDIDPFPFATEKTPWVLTQWGGSLFFYLAHDLGRLSGLKFIRIFLGVSILWLFLAYSTRRVPFFISILLTFILFFPIESRSFLRPDLFNFIFIQVFLIALFSHRTSGNWKPLLAIPMAGLLWVNLHLGSFMYGVTLIGIFFLSSLIEYIQKETGARRRLQQLAAVLTAYLLIFFLTPYGIDGFLHPFKTILMKDYLRFDLLSGNISELQPPAQILSLHYAWFYILAALCLCVLKRSGQNRFLNTLLFAVSLFLFFYGARAGAFFALVSGYMIVNNWTSLNWTVPERFARIALILTVLLCATLTIREASWNVRLNSKDFPYRFLDITTDNPSKALSVLTRNNLHGPLFNEMAYGGYILWHEYPYLKPYIDSRQINPTAFQTYLAVLSDPENLWPDLERRTGIKIALLDMNRTGNAKIIRYLLGRSDWPLVFVEGSSLLFIHSDLFPLKNRLMEFQKDLEAKNLLLPEIITRIPEYPVKDNIFTPVQYFILPPYWYIEKEQTATTLYNLGYTGAALELMEQSLQEIDDTPSRKLLHLMRSRLKEKSR